MLFPIFIHNFLAVLDPLLNEWMMFFKLPGLGKAALQWLILVSSVDWTCVFFYNLFQSSLLSAVLGELAPSHGLVSVHGRIAYVSQQPWVFSGTVRSNILFGKKYEKERYEKVIKACALKKVSDDFRISWTPMSVFTWTTRFFNFFFLNFERPLNIISYLKAVLPVNKHTHALSSSVWCENDIYRVNVGGLGWFCEVLFTFNFFFSKMDNYKNLQKWREGCLEPACTHCSSSSAINL